MRIKLQLIQAIICISLALHSSPSALANGIESHAHLFMDEGMGWLFRGSFNEPLQAKDWKSRFSSQANPEAMDRSGLDIVIATFYAHPLFTLSLRDSIRRQIELARNFVKNHSNWIIATDPKQAKSALASGKHVMILALEGASGILETEEDLKEFIDQGGIRIVTLLHLTDDEFGGVAFLKGLRALSSPIAFIKNLFHPIYDFSGDRVNEQGLTEEGRQMATRLIQRKVWIDLSHASDASQKDLIPLLTQARQPLLYTHTVLRKYHRAERGIQTEQLETISKVGGYVGLMPSEEMLEGTPPIGDCGGSVHSLAFQYREVSKIIGESSVGMGSDINGGIPHLKPSCGTETSLDQEGFWNLGQSQELWRALKNLGVYHSGGENQKNSHHFLDLWSRLWD